MSEIYNQKNGDKLEIVGPHLSKYRYFICKSLIYGNELIARIDHIKAGTVINPEKENQEFIKKEWPQNYGDILQIIEKTNEKDKDGSFFFRCRFKKYPYEFLCSWKSEIKKGRIINPKIEEEEFIKKIHKQHCGDSLKIIRKTDIQRGSYLWEAEFIKYPYRVITSKLHIVKGEVDNPLILQNEFIGKEFKQCYGETLKVVKKSNKKNNTSNDFLYLCKFIEHPCEVYASRQNIQNGCVYNPSLPWNSKGELLKYIKKTFKNKKPTLKELADSLNIGLSHIGHRINQFNLRDSLTYYESYEESTLRSFISQFVETYPEEYYISDKDGKYYGIDVYIPSKKIGFEFNGTYWHSELFKDSQYHQRKSLAAAEQGIQLFHIWEYEWSDPIKRPIIESLIKSKLGIFSQKIGASKCKIVDLSYKKYSDFCNENHIQGEAGAKVKLGLVYEGKLVQVMSFGAPRFADTIEWEIIRECSKSDTIILGGKEKLWNFFLKKYNPKSVLSYCDYSKFNGSSYLKLGFKKSRLNKPGFVWYDEKNRNIHWRNPYKHKEYSKKFIKVWDCGQLVFLWQSSK